MRSLKKIMVAVTLLSVLSPLTAEAKSAKKVSHSAKVAHYTMQKKHGAKSTKKNTPKGIPNQRGCLVAAAWNEARGRTDKEIISVMSVVRNRTNHPSFPKTMCKVVLQPGQFQMGWKVRSALISASNGGNFTSKLGSLEPADVDALTRIDGIAKIVLSGFEADPTHGALYFYSPKLRKKMGLPAKPDWARPNRTTFTASIGEFRFHKEKKIR